MGKRDTKTDVPRRIYREHIERIKQHIKEKPKLAKTGSREFVKTDFNNFIGHLLDVYETIHNAELFYANEIFEDEAEARGNAILKAKGKKENIKPTRAVMIMANDDE